MIVHCVCICCQHKWNILSGFLVIVTVTCYFIGDYESAIETLKMAITLIKQSITAGSESCQVEKGEGKRERGREG